MRLAGWAALLSCQQCAWNEQCASVFCVGLASFFILTQSWAASYARQLVMCNSAIKADKLVNGGSHLPLAHICLASLTGHSSCSSVIKASKFGPFPESLVAVYIQQVLQVRVVESSKHLVCRCG